MKYSALLILALIIPSVMAAAHSRITGSATYRERITLPPGVIFEATLEDVSKTDAADILGTFRIVSPGQPPIAFAIQYDASRIAPSHRYVIRARILQGNQLLFTADTAYPVSGAAQSDRVDIVMRRVGNVPPPGTAQ